MQWIYSWLCDSQSILVILKRRQQKGCCDNWQKYIFGKISITDFAGYWVSNYKDWIKNMLNFLFNDNQQEINLLNWGKLKQIDF